MTEPPAAEMSYSSMPGRGLLYAKPAEHDGKPAIEMLCDCAALTIITLEPAPSRDNPQELAITCEGCQSSHWLTIYPVQETP